MGVNQAVNQVGQPSKDQSQEAEVVELLPSAMYRLKLKNQQLVTAHASGAVAVNFIRLRPGDIVEVALSPNDHTRGRIIKLLRQA